MSLKQYDQILKESIIQKLTQKNIYFEKDDTLENLLINYLNVINRTIISIPRRVYISDNINKIIKKHKLNEEYIKIIFKFKYNFEKGIDMNGHLSTNIYYSNLLIKNKNKRGYRRSRDYLLDDWGIYHLHLNNKDAKNEKEMHNNRSKYLLFVKIAHNAVYFIDIYNHNEKNIFSKQELLEILDRNWHFLLKPYIISNLSSVSRMTNEEIENSRKKHAYTLVNINGKVYLPIGGGLTSAGTNIKHTQQADFILNKKNI